MSDTEFDTMETGQADIPSSQETPEGEYEVESILNKRIRRKKIEYLIKWKGYGVADATWEPSENLSCEDLIINHEKKLEEEAEQAASARRSAGRPGKTENRRGAKRPATPPVASRKKSSRQSTAATRDPRAVAQLQNDLGEGPVPATIDDFVVGVEGTEMHYFVTYNLGGIDKIVLKIDDDSMNHMVQMREECRAMYPTLTNQDGSLNGDEAPCDEASSPVVSAANSGEDAAKEVAKEKVEETSVPENSTSEEAVKDAGEDSAVVATETSAETEPAANPVVQESA